MICLHHLGVNESGLSAILTSGLFCGYHCCTSGVNWIAVYLSNSAGSTDDGFDLDLQYSAPSASLEVPGPVTGAAITTLANSISIRWTKPSCDGSSFITSYTITLSPATVTVAPVVVTDPFATSYTRAISGLLPCNTYSATIRAVNAAGASTAVTTSGKTTGCTGRRLTMM